MGSNTTNFGLYKPSSPELVDVETHLNNQLRILDAECKSLLEYLVTDVASIEADPSIVKKVGYKWFKRATNAQFYWNSSGGVSQDLYGRVHSWIPADPYLDSGWKSYAPDPLFLCLVTGSASTSEVHWDGCLMKSDESTITANSNFNVMTGFPSGYRPTVNKYFMQDAGNTASQYSMARVLIQSIGEVEVYRYGASPSGTENKIDFGGIKYTLEVAA